MVLMFLREVVEQPYHHQQFQPYSCPMRYCCAKFAEPLLLVQHVLTCPELPNGEFYCDKCSNWHEFPTNEDEWSRWRGWSGKLLHRQDSQISASGDIQRKRSFSSKMREAFTLRGKGQRKQLSMDGGQYAPSSRPGTAASGTSSMINTAMGPCPENKPMIFPGPGAGFIDMQKTPIASTAPQIEAGILWPTFDTESMDLTSAVSSMAPSTFETPTDASTNTSRTTLFNTGLESFQPPTDDMTPPFLFSPTAQFDTDPRALANHQQPTDMVLDEPIPVSGAMSPADSATPNNRTWWGGKVEIDTPRPTPVASPFFPLGQPMAPPGLTRSLSQESMQTGMSGLYQRALSEGTQMDPLSPHSEHIHHNHNHAHTHHDADASMGGRVSPTEELVCDECNWKPRGVRENLRGYLRKHKNTHKGLRLPCDVVGCTKTFSRLDNLKKHKKDKHGIEDSGSVLPLRRVAEESAEHIEEESPETRRPLQLTPAEIRGASDDYSMLWPALHF